MCFIPKSLLFTVTEIWNMTFQKRLGELENGQDGEGLTKTRQAFVFIVRKKHVFFLFSYRP